jgi:hypothetical protein
MEKKGGDNFWHQMSLLSSIGKNINNTCQMRLNNVFAEFLRTPHLTSSDNSRKISYTILMWRKRFGEFFTPDVSVFLIAKKTQLQSSSKR